MKTKKLLALLLTLVMLIGMLPSVALAEPGDPAPGGAWYTNAAKVVVKYEQSQLNICNEYTFDFDPATRELHYTGCNNPESIVPLYAADDVIVDLANSDYTTWIWLDKDGNNLALETDIADGTYEKLRTAVYGSTQNVISYSVLAYEAGGLSIDLTPTGGDPTTVMVFFDLPWYMTAAYEFEGSGTEDDPYLISNDAQLLRLSALVSMKDRAPVDGKHFLQTADIDLSGVDYWKTIGRLQFYNGKAIVNYAFSGTYDGGGHSIKNLKVFRPAYNKQTGEDAKFSFGIALFGAVEDATIKNVVIDESCSFTGQEYVAGVVGYAAGSSTIENCVNRAPIYAHAYSNNAYVGGVLGSAVDAKVETTVTNCKNYGTVTANPDFKGSYYYGGAYVGGVVGNSNWPIVNCANFGDVTGAYHVGGVAGHARVLIGCGNSGEILGDVTVQKTNAFKQTAVGGVVGTLEAVSTNKDAPDVILEGCYNTGNVTSKYVGVGGLAGHINFSSTAPDYSSFIFENCYQTGQVALDYNLGVNMQSYAGQLVGRYVASKKKDSIQYIAEKIYYASKGGMDTFGYMGGQVPEFEVTECAEDWLRGAEFLEELNGYDTVYLTYAAWRADSDNENRSLPLVSAVETKLSSAKNITSATMAEKTMEIDEANMTIDVWLPYGTVDLTSAAPTLTVSTGASVSPASGAAVDFSKGPVNYTVTAANGSMKTYAVSVHQAASADGLARLIVEFGGPLDQRLPIITDDDFSQDQHTYGSTVDEKNIPKGQFSVWTTPATASASLTWSLNGSDAANLSIRDKSAGNSGFAIPFDGESAKAVAGENTLTIRAGETTYTLQVILKPALTDLSVSAGGNTYEVTETDGAWHVELPGDVSSVTFNYTDSMIPNTPVTINGGTDKELDISALDTIQIVVGEGTYQTVYPVKIIKTSVCKVSFDVKPAGSTLVVLDKNDEIVSANADGSYSLICAEGYSYTYRAARAGYRTVEETLTAEDLSSASMKIKITLVTMSSGDGESLFPEMEGDWVSFRSNPENNGVTDALTPISAEHTELIWTAKLGTGYANAPTPPLLIGDYLYTQIGRSICRIDPETGETLATGETAGMSSYSTNPMACGAGMLFIMIDTSKGGVIQAFDAKTLESLWISETIYGQVISPLTYHNGYLYTGTWRSETADGYYFCLPVTDEDPATPDETQHVLWKLQHKGGFYWAGAYATDDYVIFGSDDGLNGYEGQSSTLYSVKPLTGEIISQIDGLTGDIRSAMCYSNGKVYFSSKGGYLYQVSVDPTGHLSNCKSFKMSGMATGTPVVYKGVVYASSLNGTDQFNSPGAVYAVDTADMTLIAQGVTRGYNQASLLLSTAYESEGKLYLYGSYNREPGGLEYMLYDTEAKTITVSDLFVPGKGMTQYGICSPICDANGTIYYKNDSGTVFALKNVKTINEQVAANLQAAKAVEEKINAIGEVTKDSAAAITAARSAYNALTADQKALVSNLSTLTAAEAKLAALNNSGSTGGGSTTTNETITVSMRLIGAELAAQDVDLGEEEYLPYYVTWIPTKTYTLDKGATVYGLWIAATSDAGIRSYGADNNYVATIWAPDSLGGYELSEFTNGYRSGWMYTVNGMHPNQGLKYWELHDGDKVVWHYINDYSYECADWFDEPQWPSLGDGTYYSLWLNAPDRFGAKGGIGGAVGGDTGAGGKPDDGKTGDTKDETPAEEIAPAEVAVKPEVTDGAARAEVSAESIAEALKENKDVDTLTVKVDTDEANKVEATLNTAAVKAAADAGIGLHVETEVGTVKLGSDTLGELAEAGKDVAVTVTANDNGTTTVSVTADGEDVEAKVRIELPAPEDGQVLVIVDAEGNETIVKKSATEDGTVYAEIPAGATVKAIEAEGGDYGDVKANAWYAEYVAFVSSHGIFQGTDTGFEPGTTMSRAMLATVLYRLEDAKAEGTSSFDDVKPATWYAEAAAWAEESGIINGTNKGFEPNAPVTREQIATMLYRYAKLIGLDTDTKSDLAKFSDGDKTSSWAQEAMSWAVSVGLFQGDEHGALNPTGEATRAQVAALVERLVKLIVK